MRWIYVQRTPSFPSFTAEECQENQARGLSYFYPINQHFTLKRATFKLTHFLSLISPTLQPRLTQQKIFCFFYSPVFNISQAYNRFKQSRVNKLSEIMEESEAWKWANWHFAYHFEMKMIIMSELKKEGRSRFEYYYNVKSSS